MKLIALYEQSTTDISLSD